MTVRIEAMSSSAPLMGATTTTATTEQRRRHEGNGIGLTAQNHSEMDVGVLAMCHSRAATIVPVSTTSCVASSPGETGEHGGKRAMEESARDGASPTFGAPRDADDQARKRSRPNFLTPLISFRTGVIPITPGPQSDEMKVTFLQCKLFFNKGVCLYKEQKTKLEIEMAFFESLQHSERYLNQKADMKSMKPGHDEDSEDEGILVVRLMIHAHLFALKLEQGQFVASSQFLTRIQDMRKTHAIARKHICSCLVKHWIKELCQASSFTDFLCPPELASAQDDENHESNEGSCLSSCAIGGPSTGTSNVLRYSENVTGAKETAQKDTEGLSQAIQSLFVLALVGDQLFDREKYQQAHDIYSNGANLLRQVCLLDGDHQESVRNAFVAGAFAKLSGVQYGLGNYSEALSLCKETLRLCPSTKQLMAKDCSHKHDCSNDHFRTRVLSVAGKICMERFDYTEALTYFHESLDLSENLISFNQSTEEKRQQDQHLQQLYALIAVCYEHLRDWREAADHYELAYNVPVDVDLTEDVYGNGVLSPYQYATMTFHADMIHGMGKAYFSMHDYPMSLALFEQVLELKMIIKADAASIALAYNSIATVLALMDRYERAESAYLSAVQLRRGTYYSDGGSLQRRSTAVIARNLTILYLQIGEDDKAANFFRQHLEYMRDDVESIEWISREFFKREHWNHALLFLETLFHQQNQPRYARRRAQTLFRMGICLLALAGTSTNETNGRYGMKDAFSLMVVAARIVNNGEGDDLPLHFSISCPNVFLSRFLSCPAAAAA